MCKRLFVFMCLLAVCGLSPNLVHGQAGMIGHWNLDEADGLTAADSSGKANNGTLLGDLEWQPGAGQSAGALSFVLTADATKAVEISTADMSPQSGTVAAWVNLAVDQSAHATRYIFGHTTIPAYNNRIQLYFDNGDTDLDLGLGDSHTRQTGLMTLDPDIWYHTALTWDSGSYVVYVDGENIAEGTYTGLGVLNPVANLGNTGNPGQGQPLQGLLDEAKIYDRALTAKEIKLVMLGRPELAANPAPSSDATDVLPDVSLNWTPGKYAVAHDVYLGTSFDDVNTAAAGTLVSEGQADAAYTPSTTLEFGQTYYWRVDEVNAAPDRTVFKGNVWNFTVEPLGYPITSITATASSSNSADMGPEKTVDGSGLNDQDQHSTTATEMWLSAAGAAPWIQYDFDKAYKLHQLLVWNSNQMIEAFVGLGAKDLVIETSVDSIEWTVLEGATLFNQATGTPDYTANTVLDFDGILAQSVKITINSGWGMIPQYGLSEVRFTAIPTAASLPDPIDGSTTDTANVALSWRTGREAVSHEVYLGTDAQDLPMVATTAENSYDAGALDYATTYYWSVTEINEAEAVPVYPGDIWSFTTPPYGIVDDFEQYDNNCNRIFFAWEDGLGHSGGAEIDNCDVPPSNGNGGGSIVGNDVVPFAEKTIVNTDSTQSLPLNYDNAFGASEATLSLDGQDWTAGGIQTLSLFFQGTDGNSGTLYVKINNAKVSYDGDAADIAGATWQRWDIDLSTVNGLQNVTSLTIGIDGATAAGMLYIDDIRLYPL
jgi:hypothetical protein